MALSGGQVRSSAQVIVRGIYPPQGVVTADPIKSIRTQQEVSIQPSTLEFGTGDETFDRVTVSDRAVPAGSSVTWDLYTGTDLLGPAGEVCAFRTIREVVISIVSGGASGIRIGGASSNEWPGWFAAAGDKRDIYAGGPPFWDGDPQGGKVVTSAAKNLKVENLSSSVECVVRVAIVGSAFNSGMPLGGLLLALTYP